MCCSKHMHRKFNIFTHNPTYKTNYNRELVVERREGGGRVRETKEQLEVVPPSQSVHSLTPRRQRLRPLDGRQWQSPQLRPSVQRPSKKVERKRATHDVRRGGGRGEAR